MVGLLNQFLAVMGASPMPASAPRNGSRFLPKSHGLVTRGLHTGRSTFNDGRNAEKRAARAAQRQHRLDDLQTYESLRGTWADQMRRAPKRNCRAVTDMLSDRRVRQIRGVL